VAFPKRVFSKLRLLFLLVSCAVAVTVIHRSAMSDSLRDIAHKHYIQGYQQGRADAMATKAFQPALPNLSVESSVFSHEYVRGYGDGYELIDR
jgi:hypothetical protein